MNIEQVSIEESQAPLRSAFERGSALTPERTSEWEARLLPQLRALEGLLHEIASQVALYKEQVERVSQELRREYDRPLEATSAVPNAVVVRRLAVHTRARSAIAELDST